MRDWKRLLLGVGISSLVLVAHGPRAAAAASPKIEPALGAKLDSAGEASFFVVLGARAHLAPAAAIQDGDARARFAYESLRQTAVSSQAPVVALLAQSGVSYRPFLIANVVHVKGDRDVAERLAALPAVARIVEERVHPLPPLEAEPDGPEVSAAGWNVARIGADAVWSAFGATGEGIVVGSIDTGVAFEHPALVRQYQGNKGGGVFDHDYSWWDPTGLCPSAAPCDNVNHGTHTVGTIVGGDGPGPDANDVGVAPGARWIAAKGCEYDFCSESSLLSAAEFMLAPTDRAGNDPDPARRPHVINNSWGSGAFDPFFADVVTAWRAAGIFPVFSNGNNGPSCQTVGSPADYPESFGVGATDAGDVVADFSSRGSSDAGVVKPNVSAPGVRVRSSIPGGGYARFSGTSMAAPHVAGAVALLWSASPLLQRDVEQTAFALESTAVDRIDTSCGGAPSGDPNNVYGSGRLDVLTACSSFCGAREELSGQVTDASTGAGIGGVALFAVRERDGAATKTETADDGSYRLGLPVEEDGSSESFTVTARAFGYVAQSFALSIRLGEPARRNPKLVALPRFTLSGRLAAASDGTPLAGVPVRIEGQPIAAVTTDASGAYSFAGVPQGKYRVEAGDGTCVKRKSRRVSLAGDTVLNLKLRDVRDAFGHRCQRTELDWIPGVDRLQDLESLPFVAEIRLPFRFPLYGVEHDVAYVAGHGYVSFEPGDAVFGSSPLPSPATPNAAIYPLWSEVFPVADYSSVRTATVGRSPNRIFVVEFANLVQFLDFGLASFELLLFERDGSMVFQWLELPFFRTEVVGIENHDGSDAFQPTPRIPLAQPGAALRISPPPLDRDGDGIVDRSDVCPFDADPGQDDRDGDGLGDACDGCPSAADPDQGDGDEDELGDACDACPDAYDCDLDGYGDGIETRLASDPAERTSTPEAREVLGACLDGVDNDRDGSRDLRATNGEAACDPDGHGLLGHPHQIVLRPFKAKKAAVDAATGRSTRVGQVKVRVVHPLRAQADEDRGLPAGVRESVTVRLTASVLEPGLACDAVLVDDPLTGEAESAASRALVLEPGARTTLRWLVQLECDPGLAPGVRRDALHVEVRATLPDAPGEVADLVRTSLASIELR